MSRFSPLSPPQENATWRPSGEIEGSRSSPRYVVIGEIRNTPGPVLRGLSQAHRATKTVSATIRAKPRTGQRHLERLGADSRMGKGSGTKVFVRSPWTGAIKRYPWRGSVSTKRQPVEASPKAKRI